MCECAILWYPIQGLQGGHAGRSDLPHHINMVVDVVIHHWATVVEVEELGIKGFWREVQTLETLFYADGGLLASPWSSRIQESMDVLMDLFDSIGLRKNVNNMVGIICQLCRTASRQSKVAYNRRMAGEGPSYRAR